MPYYGRHVTAAESDFGIVADGGQRASVYEVMPANGWGHTLGIFAGKDSGTPSVELGAWKADSSMNPAGRMGYGVAFSPAAGGSGCGLSSTGPASHAGTARVSAAPTMSTQVDRRIFTTSRLKHAMYQLHRIGKTSI